MATDSDTSRRAWVEQALQYAKHYGWEIVPINPEPGLPKNVKDPALRQLGASLLVDDIDEATSEPSGIQELGRRFSDAEIGARTGKESGLLAVELKGGGKETLFHERIDEVAQGTFRVTAPNREYILFPYPDVEPSLPAVTEKKEAVLHGDGSVVYLPWNRYEWQDPSFEEDRPPPRAVAEVLFSLFGLEAYLPADEQTGEERIQKEAAPPRRSTPPETAPARPPQPDVSFEERKTNGHSPNPDSEPLFRSGKELALSEDEPLLNLPWTVPGGLSVLTAPPKTSGTSTWALNLAAHLVSGTPYLGFENPPCDVVLLADTSPANLRGLLGSMEFLKEQDLSRLHVMHARDVPHLDWASTLKCAYEHVRAVGADLLIIDCLNRYVAMKGGGAPTEEQEVAHMLTAEAPAESAVLAVKNTACIPRESFSRTISRLGTLGLSADAILRLDDVSTDRHPRLRRLLTISRSGPLSSTHLCTLKHGRYERVPREKVEGLAGKDPFERSHSLDRDSNTDPLPST